VRFAGVWPLGLPTSRRVVPAIITDNAGAFFISAKNDERGAVSRTVAAGNVARRSVATWYRGGEQAERRQSKMYEGEKEAGRKEGTRRRESGDIILANGWLLGGVSDVGQERRHIARISGITHRPPLRHCDICCIYLLFFFFFFSRIYQMSFIVISGMFI